jgi:hypothetical protein
MLRGVIAASAAALVLAAPAARATLINIQFGTVGNAIGLPVTPAYTGAGVFGSAGDTWNLFKGPNPSTTPGSNLPLVDSTGAATSATLSYLGENGFFDSSNSVIKGLMGTTSYANLLDSYLYTRGTATITVSGLTSGAAYDLVVYSIANSAGRTTNVTAGGSAKSVVAAGTPTLVEGEQYVEFDGLVANGSGLISFTARGAAGEGDVNGFQLSSAVAAPEPATVTLVFAGMAMLRLCRVRRFGRV